MTFRAQVYLLVAAKPRSGRQIADEHGLPHRPVLDVLSALRVAGYIEVERTVGRQAIYRITDRPPPTDGVFRADKAKRVQSRKRRSYDLQDGYGSEPKPLLTEVWQ